MKYVMMQIDAGAGMKRNFPILFSDDLTHAFVADAIVKAIARDTHEMASPVSAGFVNMSRCEAFGSSESLHLSSRPEDSRIIMIGGGTEKVRAA